MSDVLGSGYSVYGDDAKAAANKYGIPVNWFLALIQSESSFDPNAIHTNNNGTFDYGIAQLNSKYFPNAAGMSTQEQLDAAAQHLKSKYNGSWAEAIRGYKGANTPQSNVDKVINLASQLDTTAGFDPNADTQAVINGGGFFGSLFGAMSPDGVSPSPSEVKGTTDAAKGIGSDVVAFLKGAAGPIAIIVVAGALIIFSIGGALMGSAPNITVKATK